MKKKKRLTNHCAGSGNKNPLPRKEVGSITEQAQSRSPYFFQPWHDERGKIVLGIVKGWFMLARRGASDEQIELKFKTLRPADHRVGNGRHGAQYEQLGLIRGGDDYRVQLDLPRGFGAPGDVEIFTGKKLIALARHIFAIPSRGRGPGSARGGAPPWEPCVPPVPSGRGAPIRVREFLPKTAARISSELEAEGLPTGGFLRSGPVFRKTAAQILHELKSEGLPGSGFYEASRLPIFHPQPSARARRRAKKEKKHAC
jgi:hypothetical protein